jgi:hypothetical protein
LSEGLVPTPTFGGDARFGRILMAEHQVVSWNRSSHHRHSHGFVSRRTEREGRRARCACGPPQRNRKAVATILKLFKRKSDCASDNGVAKTHNTRQEPGFRLNAVSPFKCLIVLFLVSSADVRMVRLGWISRIVGSRVGQARIRGDEARLGQSVCLLPGDAGKPLDSDN